MKMKLLTLLLISVSGGEPDLERRFQALQESKAAKYLEISGVQLGCIDIATNDFRQRLKDDPLLAKYGSKVEDFNVVVIEQNGSCVVAFGARGKRMGGGMEYWIEKQHVAKKGYSK